MKVRQRDGEEQTKVVTRDPRAPARWAAWAHDGRRWHNRDKPGRADGCEAGRTVVNKWALECRRCGALVDWRCAKAAAKKRKREWLARSDGCGSKRCARTNYHYGRFCAGQRAMAAALQSGDRILVAWPADALDRDVWQRPAAVQAAKAAAVAAAHAQ